MGTSYAKKSVTQSLYNPSCICFKATCDRLNFRFSSGKIHCLLQQFAFKIIYYYSFE